MTKERGAKLLGPWMSIAMVMGYMIGSAIFLLPATLAPYGVNALIAWGVTVGGTMCLALALSRLAARNPGGPQAYVQQAFGRTAAYFIMWMYWVSVFTSTAGIAVAFGGAATATVGSIAGPAWVVPLAICAIFVVAAINLRGVHSAGEFQVRHDADQAASADRRDTGPRNSCRKRPPDRSACAAPDQRYVDRFGKRAHPVLAGRL